MFAPGPLRRSAFLAERPHRLLASAPTAEQFCQVGCTHVPVTVEVRRATRARSPTAEQHAEIIGADHAVAVKVSDTRRPSSKRRTEN